MAKRYSLLDRYDGPLKKASIVVFALLALGTAGFSAPEVKPSKLPSAVKLAEPGGRALHELRVIAFGSSSTEGIGASNPSATYPSQLQTVLVHMLPKGETVEVVNCGVGGQDADDMVKRLQKDVIAANPDVVIWQTGSNDPLRNVPLSRFEADTREGIKAMRQAGVAVILMEPQWCPRLEQAAHADDYRQVVRKIGQELGVPVIRRSDMMRRWIAEGRMTRAQCSPRTVCIWRTTAMLHLRATLRRWFSKQP